MRNIDKFQTALFGAVFGLLILVFFGFLPLMAFTKYTDPRIIILIPAFMLYFGFVFYRHAEGIRKFMRGN